MMDEETGAAVVAALVDNRLKPGPWAGLPPGGHIATLDEAYDLQDLLHGALSAAGLGERTGYKIGCTSAVMQKFMNIDHPCSGGVMANSVYRSGAVVPREKFYRLGIECEIAVRLATAITPGQAPFDKDNVAGLIASVMPAIELVDERYADFRSLDTPTLVVDDFFDAGCVLGPEVTDWRKLDVAANPSAVTARTIVNGQQKGMGTAADILGHPLEALAWFANHNAKRGKTISAGEFILLGSMVEVQWLTPGDQAAIEIDGLGALTIEWASI